MSDATRVHSLIALIAVFFAVCLALHWPVFAGDLEPRRPSGSPIGAKQESKPLSAARFKDNADGTVTDHLTGLVWLKDANRFGMKRWADAWNDCKYLAHDEENLRDGSAQGDWRLPYVEELQGMAGSGFNDAAVSKRVEDNDPAEGCPFSNVKPAAYWSWPTYKYGAALAWTVHLPDGLVTLEPVNLFGCVWCVREPH